MAFYNVENLFDAQDNPHTFDDDYTAEGKNQWTTSLVDQKVEQLSKVISTIGYESVKRPPLIIGLAEVENRPVLEKIVFSKKLKVYDYGIIHFDSPDFRGIDVAFLYQKKHFKPTHQKIYPIDLTDPKTGYKRTTRDILVVSGYLNRHYLSFLVNHWPSRRGGKVLSSHHRMRAAFIHKKITDSLFKKFPSGKIISMGEYNDNPSDKSLRWIMGKDQTRQLVNPMMSLAKKRVGSLAYNDRWFLFDQILFSPNWLNDDHLFLIKAHVFRPLFLKTLRGRFQGYPYRVEKSNGTLRGYSDHFPVYAINGEKL